MPHSEYCLSELHVDYVSHMMLGKQVLWSLRFGYTFGLGNVKFKWNEVYSFATLLSNLEVASVTSTLSFEAHINMA